MYLGFDSHHQLQTSVYKEAVAGDGVNADLLKQGH